MPWTSGTGLTHRGVVDVAKSATLQHDDAREAQYASWSSRRAVFSILKGHEAASNFKRDSTDTTCTAYSKKLSQSPHGRRKLYERTGTTNSFISKAIGLH